ncbi:basic leucine zipper 4-like [Gastrolobium bilobum]|uniref:basic leucine zipper 4-like n=1 Tax=Gastrolobium bilobum TaxID=150636 RepID=UPI002AB07AB2|nr:basic leucine zipper 4-like [Gastrolobium bilobum]
MSFHDDEAVQFPSPPVLETMLTESEIQSLFSLINQSGDPASPSSGSQGSNRVVYSTEERKLRRMQSNRDSARRSRYRKKKHLENLRNQVNRLRIENRELKNRLAYTMHQHLLLSLQNDQLRSESVALLATLSDLYGILGTMLSQ